METPAFLNVGQVSFHVSVSLLLPNFPTLDPGAIFTVPPGLGVFVSQCPAGQDWGVEDRHSNGSGDMTGSCVSGSWSRVLCL